MNCLHVGKYYAPYFGGIENFMADLLPEQLAQGIRVRAIVHRHRVAGDCGPNQLEGVPLVRVPILGRLLFTPLSPLFPIYLARELRRHPPDLIHIHLPNVSAFWLLLFSRSRSVPWVVHWHSDVLGEESSLALRIAYRIYRWFEQAMLRRAARIIVTSPPYLKSSEPLLAWKGKCSVIPLGLRDTGIVTDSQLASRWSSDDDRLRVLCIGRLTFYKGQEFLIRAAVDVPDCQVLIVGAGERMDILKAEVQRQHLGARVGLVGSLPKVELASLLRDCDCLVLPSISRAEAFGVVLLEAMRCSKPVIVTDIAGSGMAWVIVDGVTGKIVPPADAVSLAQALNQFESDRPALAKLGAAARLRFIERFGIVAVQERIAEVYTQCRASG